MWTPEVVAKYLAAFASLGVMVWLAYIGKYDPSSLGQLAFATLGGVIGHSMSGGKQ